MIVLSGMVPHVADAPVVFHQLHGYIPYPDESHRIFGVGFLILGALFVAEALSGSVWHRNQLRTELWPATLMLLGWGLLIVTLIEPGDRIIHASVGAILLAAGLVERRHRHGLISRRTADLAVILAIAVGAMEMGVFHSHGELTSRGFIVHATYGVTGAAVAAGRLYQAGDIFSLRRSVAVGLIVIVLGLELLALAHGSVAPRTHALPDDEAVTSTQLTTLPQTGAPSPPPRNA
jgi:hypothetical protein